MKTKRKMNPTTRRPEFYCSSYCRHILITFVGMALLIVNYGVNAAQMPAEPQTNENCIRSINRSSRCVTSDEALFSVNGNNSDKTKLLWTRSGISSNLKKVARPETPMISGKANFLNNVTTSGANQTASGSVGAQFRDPRLFGLLGSNFSLSYNLTLSTGNSVGNITVISPAPAPAYYYYAPAPSYPYYPYYSYYDAYNPYASSPQYYYDPNTGYVYYG